MRILFTAFFFLFTSYAVHAQSVYAEKESLQNLEAHVNYLADDKLEGRLAGSTGEQLAIEYLKKHIKAYKLKSIPGLEQNIQAFDFFTSLAYTGKNELLSKKKAHELDKDFYPVPVSANGMVKGKIIDCAYGIDAKDLNHNDFANKKITGNIVLINLESPDGHHPHSKYKAYNAWADRINMALSYNPSAIILYNSSVALSIQSLRSYNNLARVSVPVIHVENECLEEIKNSKKVSLQVQMSQQEKKAFNVAGFIDNKSKTTVVLGAHFDHLGYGEYGNSLYRGEKAIHNGADDNASGTAMVLEMARIIAKRKDIFKQHNYLIMFFSAEELGLLGSNYFTKSGVFDELNFTYMLNFDMVGRLESTDKPKLAVLGTGTSPVWDSVLQIIPHNPISINTSASGLGSSDHTSFYLNEVPALHFFTGTHEDYHKPSDDAEKINFSGMVQVMEIALQACASLENKGKIPFTKTNDEDSRKAPKFTVTLGIVPDYMGNDMGLQIDGVSDGKPAQLAGIKKGDIITKMGDRAVVDMMSYMNALSLLKKGDHIVVEILRDGEKMSIPVQF